MRALHKMLRDFSLLQLAEMFGCPSAGNETNLSFGARSVETPHLHYLSRIFPIHLANGMRIVYSGWLFRTVLLQVVLLVTFGRTRQTYDLGLHSN